MLGRHYQIGGRTLKRVLNTLQKMLELAPYCDVRHQSGARKLIGGNDEFIACLRLVKKALHESTLS
jgi:hypothetical protein